MERGCKNYIIIFPTMFFVFFTEKRNVSNMKITECYESRTLVTCSWRENKLKIPTTDNSNRPG